ncbi:MAG: hypothetical protein P0Y66_02870 [Candidatus Kaistia colombiensis]|nr:MAG: hypothetical protein P0Y66_02870 [Kaistia sp.]
MKITDIRAYIVEDDHPQYPFRWREGLAGSGDGTPLDQRPKSAILRMDTDEGITGAIKIGDGETIASLTRRRLKSLIGENPLMTERLWTKIWEIDRIEELHMRHLGLIDQLAWDIKAKKAGLPLYQLLGGNSDRIQAYASTVTWNTMDEYERYIKECMDVGFTAFKLHAWGDAKLDAKLCHNLRKWTGDDAALMFDGSAGWDFRHLALVRAPARGCRLPLVRGADARIRPAQLCEADRAARNPGAGRRDLGWLPLERGHLDRHGRARHDAHLVLLQGRHHRRDEGGASGGIAWHAGAGARHGRRQRAYLRRHPEQ